jgi:hypothetical protein
MARVLKRYRSSIWVSGSGYGTQIPKRMLRYLSVFRDICSYEVVWCVLEDGSITVRIKAKQGVEVPVPAQARQSNS